MLQGLQQMRWCQSSCVHLQAAGRVWRDGQKKRVYVYRFLATGSIEEKVGMISCLLSCASLPWQQCWTLTALAAVLPALAVCCLL